MTESEQHQNLTSPLIEEKDRLKLIVKTT
jgi:hypothetical protein